MKNTIKTLMIVLVMTLLCVAMAMTVSAEGIVIEEGTCGGVSYDGGMSDDGGVKYTLYDDGTLEIYGEGEIRSNYFDMAFGSWFTNVIIKDGVTKISYGVFEWSGIESITIAESVTLIASHAFDGCYSLQSITILNPDCEIYDSYDTIGFNATIYGYEGSTAQSYAEQYDRNFKIICDHQYTTEITAKEASCYTFGNEAFVKCDDCKEIISGSKNVIVPSHTDKNDDGNCDVCEKTMPVESGTCGGYVVDDDYSDDNWDDEYDNYDGSVRYYKYADGTLEIFGEGEIEPYAFLDYTSVYSATIMDGITKISRGVFADCYSLRSVTILNPDCEIYESSNTIYSKATIYGFEGSTAENYANDYDREFKVYCPHESTTDVAEIPASCYTKGYTAGAKCNNCGDYAKGGKVIEPSHKDENTDGLCDICEKTIPTETGSCGGNIYELSSEYFSDGAARYYKYADGTLEIFGEGAIKHYAFDYDNTITKVIIMDGITEILEEAFYECKKIESVSFPETLTFIDYFAFANCTSLKSVVIPNSIEQFITNAFDNCARLEEFVLPEAIYNIPGANFQGCIRLAKITVMNPDCKIASDPAVFPESATLYGHEGSTLQEYAEDWNRKFVVIGTEDDGDDDGNIGGEETPEIPHEHKFPTEWSTITEATCSQNGIAIRVCKQCSVFEYTVTPAYGHFDDDGDKFCDDCKVVIALPEQDETPEDTHTHSFPIEWSVLSEATCSQSGIAIRVCEGCSVYEYDTVPAFGHNDADGDKLCDSCKVALGLPEIPSTPEAPSQNTSTSAFAFLTDLINQLMDLIKKAFNIA